MPRPLQRSGFLFTFGGMSRINEFRDVLFIVALVICLVATTARIPVHVKHKDEPLVYLNYLC